MSDGKRSWEFAAIPITFAVIGILAIVLWSANAGGWVWAVLGILGLVALGVVTALYMRRPSRSAAPPPEVAHVDDGVHRVLVIADDDCAPAELGAALAGGRGGPTAVFVVAPALGSRTARWTGDDRAYQDAQERLDAVLQALAGLDVEAKGHVGPHDPLQAADDSLREFAADEIVFAINPAGTNWLEEGVVDAARERYAIPVRELVIGGS